MKAEKTLKGKVKKKAIVYLTREAQFCCEEYEIIPDLVLDLITEAPDFILSKKEGDRFAIVSETPQMVVCGEIVYVDDEEIEIIISKVYQEKDIYFLSSKFQDVHKV